MPRKGTSPSSIRTSVESAGGKWFVYDHAFREIKAGPFDSYSDAKAAHAIIKSRARYTTSPRHHVTIPELRGMYRKYPSGQKPHKKNKGQTISAEHADVFIHNRKSKNPGVGKSFYFLGSATSKLAARKIERKHPGSFIHEKDGRYYVLKPKKVRSNPGVPIYGRVIRIEAEKTWPHEYGGQESKATQKYYHDFTSKNAMIYGLPDGSLLIKSKKK